MLGNRLVDTPGGRHKGALEKMPTEFAWHVHTAQESWSSKADVKASILLALEGGILLAVFSVLTNGSSLNKITGWDRNFEITGTLLLLCAVSAATIVIFPRLGRAGKRCAAGNHFIFFGNVRHWDEKELAAHLMALTTREELDAISRQLVIIAKQNWRKHRWVQGSLILGLIGTVMISAGIIVIF